MEENKNVRDFKLTAWALKNQNTIYLAIISLFIFGFISYTSLPKELFPEINYPTVFVQTIYPGNSSADIENLITKPLEKELKGIDGVNSIKSTSGQDVSMVFVEFNPNIKIKDVLPDVKDAVDRAKNDLPSDLRFDPNVIELDFSQFPVITINLSGDYNVDELKKYADFLKDELEKISEVSKVNISGLSEKEIQVNVDVNKLNEMGIGFTTVENAIRFENLTMSAGDIILGDTRKSIRIVGEYTSIEDIKNIIIKTDNGKVIYLKDVAEVLDTYADAESYARLNNKTVVSLQVVKKNGENLISTVDNVLATIDEIRDKKLIPDNLTITITNNQSDSIKNMLGSLESNIFSGIIVVVLILFLFLGLRNSVIVGFSIPMSMLITFVVMKITGWTVNMMTLFSLVLALGMLVDNAIVIVENIYRFVDNGYSIKDATRMGTSEVAVPIITSTLTTLAAFFPLIFWRDIMGEFMKLLPITLIIVLSASLFNALVFTPVISKVMIKPASQMHKPEKKKTLIWSAILVAVAIPFYLIKSFLIANLLTLSAILFLSYTFALFDVSKWFQENFLSWLERTYSKFIKFSLRKRNPEIIILSTTVLMFLVIGIYFGVTKPKVVLFPNNQPHYINIYAELPVDADVKYTDSIFSEIVNDIDKQLLPYRDMIESELVSVGSGVSYDRGINVGKTYNKGQLTLNFVEYKYRKNINTSQILQDLSIYLKNRYPGVKIIIEKNRMGPPSGKAISIEINGNEFDQLLAYSDSIISKIENAQIDGIEKLSLDIITNKPEIIITVDKEKAGRYGLTTSQVASTIRTSIFGSEVSKFKTEDDDYPIMVRSDKSIRYNLSALMNQTVSFRNSQGVLVEIPISSVASITIDNNFDAIKHVDTKRTITISSNVIEGYNANDVNKQIKQVLSGYKLPNGYEYGFSGEQKDMKKSMEFLSIAMLVAVALIMIILVAQFNSVIKPLIIMATVGLSTIGVFGGLATFQMDFVIIMTGIGIIALAGVVVNNAIVLIDYIDYLKQKRKVELGMDLDDNLPLSENVVCIAKAGSTRLRPVLLTAITTVLGLITLAIGMNLNFTTLFTKFDPDFYLGGDSVGFWGPLSWTVIFGLTFATFMTLVVVPAMYLVGNKIKLYFRDKEKLKM